MFNMSTEAKKEKREVKYMIGFRPAELTPLLNMWLQENPHTKITVLLKRSLKANPEIRKLAGKRYAHLLAA